ncbi:Filamin-A [Fragariocoptes setiger]|uniref:Filamin-A n=1 Tax=Fragariocoptes setiger TaxID=1670756 RepID=A0ABQ7S7Z6_9ACAR|nr:Filamin-A [Fragariocoptes setiger]
MPSAQPDKAIIVDNKDGTVKISYDPKEVGAHELSLRYNDEPIHNSPITFYVDSVAGGSKKVTAYGPGLSHGTAGDPCKFTINTGGLGAAKLGVAVEGPSKSQVSLTDNKDGTITASYLPQIPGQYTIKLTFDGKPVVGSPYQAKIGDEGRKRAQISIGQGSERGLDLKVSEHDLKIINAVIVTPSGLEEPCSLKQLSNGQLAISFTPREQGQHTVNVKRLGNHMQGSPFKFDVLSRDIGDAKQVKISGKGIKEGKTNVDNEIIISTKEAGFGGLSVSVEGPSKADLSSRESADGTLKVYYKPFEPGYYTINIKYADHVVPGSPFTIKVSGSGSNPQKSTLRKVRKAEPTVDVNSECHFSFKLPSVSAYDLSARVQSPQGKIEDASIVDMGDYVYQVKFVPKEVGMYVLSVRDKDIHMLGSPFPYTVGPMQDFGAHRVRCGGPGLVRGTCGPKPNEFNVYTREAGPGELSVCVEGPSAAKLTFTDRKDGSCHVGYTVDAPGEYRISVLFDNQEVPDSPYKAYIMPQTGDVAKIELGPLPPDNMIQLNKPCNFTVIMNGAKGNIEGKVLLPSGKLDDCFASPIDAENWAVRFIPRELGIHQVQIKFNKGTVHIPQSPIYIRVGHDNADPAAVLVHGHGLRDALVNHATDFTIETCNAGHGTLEVTIEGPSKVSMDCTEVDEGYKVHYTPLAEGEYYAIIKYNGCHVNGSPFKVRAVRAPGSKHVADPGNHETASVVISTTDKQAKQKAENVPKFKSDASKVYCKGMGLKKAFVNKPNTLTVNCSDAGFNMLFASFLGPTRATIHDVSVKHMGGSIYQVNYMCKDRGDAMLVVNYGDESIPGSPFKIEVV